MKNLPILTLRKDKSLAAIDIPWVAPLLQEALQVIEDDRDILGPFNGETRIANLSNGIKLVIYRETIHIHLHISRNGKRIRLDTPDFFAIGLSERDPAGSFPDTAAASIKMTLATLSGDLISDDDRASLQERHDKFCNAVANAVVAANVHPIDYVTITPYGAANNPMRVCAAFDGSQSSLDIPDAYDTWNPIRCMGLNIKHRDTDEVEILVQGYAGCQNIEIGKDPMNLLRRMSLDPSLPPVPPLLIPDDEWLVIF